jgi:hypothetical protein
MLVGALVVGFEAFALVYETCPADNRVAGMIWLDSTSGGEREYAEALLLGSER